MKFNVDIEVIEVISKKNDFMAASFQDVCHFLLNSKFIKNPENPKMINGIRN